MDTQKWEGISAGKDHEGWSGSRKSLTSCERWKICFKLIPLIMRMWGEIAITTHATPELPHHYANASANGSLPRAQGLSSPGPRRHGSLYWVKRACCCSSLSSEETQGKENSGEFPGFPGIWRMNEWMREDWLPYLRSSYQSWGLPGQHQRPPDLPALSLLQAAGTMFGETRPPTVAGGPAAHSVWRRRLVAKG